MISMNKCRIVGAIALPIQKDKKKPERKKYTQRSLKVPLGPKIIQAYIEKNKKSK